MAKHRPGAGMTPVTDLIGSVEPPVWPGADEDYGDELREMRESIAEDVHFERTHMDAASRYQEEVDA